MKTLHLLGHNYKWNIDTFSENKVGNGFVFCAYSFSSDWFTREKIEKLLNLTPDLFLDMQYFGKKESTSVNKGKLKTYNFHPANISDNTQTNIYLFNCIIQGIDYQISIGLKNIIIPNYCESAEQDLKQFCNLVRLINNWLKSNRKAGYVYYMSIPLSHYTLVNSNNVEELLHELTDMDIIFDGYYIVCESQPEYKQKISTNIKYYSNVSRLLTVLKKNQFSLIYAYANWDALVFLSLSDIDYITIGTFEKLRNFNVESFLSADKGGGPSKGWYFSEKLLNFVKAQLLALVHDKGCITLIENERNIFSDAILRIGYQWNNLKPEVHKNYLTSIDGLLHSLSEVELQERKSYLINKIKKAVQIYQELERKKVFLFDESSNYHLGTWLSFLLSK